MTYLCGHDCTDRCLLPRGVEKPRVDRCVCVCVCAVPMRHVNVYVWRGGGRAAERRWRTQDARAAGRPRRRQVKAAARSVTSLEDRHKTLTARVSLEISLDNSIAARHGGLPACCGLHRPAEGGSSSHHDAELPKFPKRAEVETPRPRTTRTTSCLIRAPPLHSEGAGARGAAARRSCFDATRQQRPIRAVIAKQIGLCCRGASVWSRPAAAFPASTGCAATARAAVAQSRHVQYSGQRPSHGGPEDPCWRPKLGVCFHLQSRSLVLELSE